MNFVTGASSGIGRSLARRIAAAGEPVAAVARREELLDSLVKEIEAAGGRALALRCDVTDRDAVREAVRRAEAALGPTARLVANAGGSTPTDAGAFDAASLAALLELNVLGVAHCVEAVLPGMLARGSGHIVAVSSLAAYRGLPGAGGYAAAKAALTALMEGLRIDLAPRGIDVTTLAPGFVRTRPGRKRNRPFVLELEPATERMFRAIERRRRYYAFPTALRALAALGWALPAGLYDRLLRGRGPVPKARR